MRARRLFAGHCGFLLLGVILVLCLGCDGWERPAPSRYPARATAIANPPKEVTLDLGDDVTMKMVLIPAGRFLMGSAEEEPGSTFTNPLHEVTITRPFYMSIYEVTQAQYEKVMGENPSVLPGGSELPVNYVHWGNAVKFCNTLSEKTQADIRLPTEAEWEYACRAGSTARFCYGDDCDVLGDYAWYQGSRGDVLGPHPVGQKKPNAFGLYDMHGNVREWCGDRAAILDDEHKTDPTGPASGEETYIIRGGEHQDGSDQCTCSRREWQSRWCRRRGIGFRVVME